MSATAASAAPGVTDQPGALVRLPVAAGPWAESLPPAPAGGRVTMSFSSPALRDEHGEAVELLGYVVVDGHDGAEPDDLAWLVVTAELARAHPRWWAGVRLRADAVYSLEMGPVLRRFAPVLAPHLA